MVLQGILETMHLQGAVEMNVRPTVDRRRFYFSTWRRASCSPGTARRSQQWKSCLQFCMLYFLKENQEDGSEMEGRRKQEMGDSCQTLYTHHLKFLK